MLVEIDPETGREKEAQVYGPFRGRFPKYNRVFETSDMIDGF